MRFCLVFLSCLFLSSPLFGAIELKTYQAEVSVRVFDNDIVVARKTALKPLRKSLISQAVREALGNQLYAEYENLLKSKILSSPNKFLLAVEVIREGNTDTHFTMQLQGKVNISTLKTALRALDLPLDSDPWFKVSVVFSEDFSALRPQMGNRLALFHVKPTFYSSPLAIQDSPNNIPLKELITRLFLSFPDNPIIHYVTLDKKEVVEEPEKIQAQLRLQIFRKSDLKRLNSFQIKIPPQKEKGLYKKLGKKSKLFLKLYSKNSLKVAAYELGKKEKMILQVAGVRSPWEREIFRLNFLEKNRVITGATLIRFDDNAIFFEINSKENNKKVMTSIMQQNPFFQISGSILEKNLIFLQVDFLMTRRVKKLNIWSPKENIMDNIRALWQNNPEKVEEVTPGLVESEPNNKSMELNSIPLNTWVLGTVSSRSDEDLFEVRGIRSNKTLRVSWIRLGKTRLSPQMRIYDENFNFLNDYRLVGSQTRQNIRYRFRSAKTEKIYLRISDQVGFIPEEAGGFQSYHYMVYISSF